MTDETPRDNSKIPASPESASPIDLDEYSMLEYRAYLHGGECYEYAGISTISLGCGVYFDASEEMIVTEIGRSTSGSFDQSFVGDRMEELMEEGVEELEAEEMARQEALDLMNSADAAWSDDLVPKLKIRVGPRSAFVQPYLDDGIDPVRDPEAYAEIEPFVTLTVEDYRAGVQSWIGEYLKWSDVEWAEEGSPLPAAETIAWRSSDDAIMILKPASDAEMKTLEDWWHDVGEHFG